jgi:hypothetical protein
MPPQLQQNPNFPHTNFPTNSHVPAAIYGNPQQTQLNQMMGNLNLGMQSSPMSLQQQQQQQQQHMHQQQQQQQQQQPVGPALQLTQPMTYLQQQNNPSSQISYQKR